MLEGSEIGTAAATPNQRKLGKSYPVGKGKSGNVQASAWPGRDGAKARVHFQVSERVGALPVSGYVNFTILPDDLETAKARAIKDARDHGFAEEIN